MKKLQVFAAFSVVGLALSSLPAPAFENYVATGHAYAPGHERLPPLNSELDRLNANVDIIESDVYNRELIAKKFQDNVKQFMDNRSIRSQTKLQELLRERGIEATQSSISRDLRDQPFLLTAPLPRTPDSG